MKNSAFIKLASEADSAYEDIYVTYGVSFIKGAYIEMLKRSAAKEYVKNESRLSDGSTYVAKPQYAKYQEKTFSVQILLEASSRSQFSSRFEAFCDKISSGMFFLKVPSRYRVFKLVYSNIRVQQEYKGNKAIFTIDLKEPNPKDRITLT